CSTDPFPCKSRTTLVRTGRVLVGAGGMTSRAKVVFPVRNTKTGKAGTRRVGGTFRTRTRILVRVPSDAITGAIRVVVPGPHYSKGARVTVVHAPLPAHRAPLPSTGTPGAGAGFFAGSGMWVWYLNRDEGGDPDAIAAKAAAAGVHTIFVKSADGDDVWSQFSRTAVAALKATGLNVCAWQFVYGNDPAGEARAASVAAANGADCFVIDAEGAYEGKYAQAQTYMTDLRAAVGPDFPIALTSFPYINFHGAFPYSVFMAPGNATFNLPQVYWKAIGDSPDVSLATTYLYNRVYGPPVYPLGQAYDGTTATDVQRFRQLSEAYGARGVSWWVWDQASAANWTAIGKDLPSIPAPADPGFPTLSASGSRTGSRGDLVVLAQEHLAGADQSVAVDGDFGPGTARAVRAYQAAKGLTQTGQVDAATWPVLMRETPVEPDWAALADRAKATAKGASASIASVRVGQPRFPAVNGPASASMRARRYEIPRGPLKPR
ncbi:MAG TPA: peptidoglycan-binding domain-containing protein, partial [Conexibacter sp.]